MDLSVSTLWTAMGPFARTVVVLLCAMSLASLATAIDRLLAVRGAARATGAFVPQWRAVLAAPVPAEARREAFDRAIRHAVLTTSSRLKRGLPILATVGATAPFVGLVGTVAGIVNAFDQIATTGQGGVGQVSAGIAEALVTTAVGIAVAVPAVWLYNFLTQRIGRLLADVESAAQSLAVETLTGGRP
jgi:biopolymer transport protein ExbB/TolQ